MERLLTIQEVAAMVNMSVSGIYGLSFKRQIPVVRLSARCIRFRKSDIDNWIADKATPADAKRPQSILPKGRRPGRPRKNNIANAQIDNIIAVAKKEVMG